MVLTLIFSGLKATDYPKETNEQSAKAVEIVKDLVLRVLGRDETFSLVVRKSAQRRYAKDSNLVLIPPIEVLVILQVIIKKFAPDVSV